VQASRGGLKTAGLHDGVETLQLAEGEGSHCCHQLQ
jgi:hypothetical protein